MRLQVVLLKLFIKLNKDRDFDQFNEQNRLFASSFC